MKVTATAGHGGGKPRIPVKIGDGSIRDRVDLHAITQGPHTIACEVSPRRGYLLATFEFRKASK